VRINACGILDVTEYSPNQSPEDLQVEDLRDLGCLICSLASSSICIKTDNNSLTKGVEYVKQFYSAELSEVVAYLLAPALDGQTISIEGLLRMLWSRSLDEMTKVFKFVLPVLSFSLLLAQPSPFLLLFVFWITC
jgi:hypothetical protein